MPKPRMRDFAQVDLDRLVQECPAVPEDPVTGSLNASIAQWLIGSGAAPRAYTASQGTRVGRRGRIDISCDETGTIWVGGATTTCIRGAVTI